MFCHCASLKELNLSNFIINIETDMRAMFYGCSSLIELTIPQFNTSNVNQIYYMFSFCPNELIMKVKTRFRNIREEAFKCIYKI